MDPTVVAAVIAAAVSVLTLVGTLAAQYFGRRATSRDTKETLEQQREQLDLTLAEQARQLDRTLAEQSKQLDLTLAEQSRQLDQTLAEQRTRTLNERFATAAGQLGSDQPAAVRLAGVYAMAGLADDWNFSKANQQTCVDVLCAYLRMPYEPDPGKDSPEQLAFRSGREVRHTVIRVIAAHLKKDAAVSWQGLSLDFNGVVFDGGDFRGAEFSDCLAVFDNAEFSGGTVRFNRAKFSGDRVFFGGARFSGGTVRFELAEFSGGTVSFRGTELSDGNLDFRRARFTGSAVNFGNAKFSGGTVDFDCAKFSGGIVSFPNAEFSGGEVNFDCAEFSGGTVDFRDAGDWSFPPTFPWTGKPPSGVKLPVVGQL
jgi:uncharacterized protein YjbI with pentapeptide repeats